MIGRDISASGQSGQAGPIKSWKRSEKKDQLAKTLLEPEKTLKTRGRLEKFVRSYSTSNAFMDHCCPPASKFIINLIIRSF